jgi:dTDP-4-dehydrorhamnose reductase
VGSAATAPWVVTGCDGQLGSALTQLLEGRGVETVAVDLPELDITDAGAVDAFLAGVAPTPAVLVNAAAFTHVDRCEREPVVAERVNALAPELLARACRSIGTRLVHVSTDYVFGGDAETPYVETDPTEPHCVYGRTKLAGERGVLAASDEFLGGGSGRGDRAAGRSRRPGAVPCGQRRNRHLVGRRSPLSRRDRPRRPRHRTYLDR